MGQLARGASEQVLTVVCAASKLVQWGHFQSDTLQGLRLLASGA